MNIVLTVLILALTSTTGCVLDTGDVGPEGNKDHARDRLTHATIVGNIGMNDPITAVFPNEGAGYNAYQFVGRLFEHIHVELASPTGNPRLFVFIPQRSLPTDRGLWREGNGGFVENDNDDRSDTGTLNSRVSFRAPYDGTYLVVVENLNPGVDVPYELRVNCGSETCGVSCFTDSDCPMRSYCDIRFVHQGGTSAQAFCEPVDPRRACVSDADCHLVPAWCCGRVALNVGFSEPHRPDDVECPAAVECAPEPPVVAVCGPAYTCERQLVGQ